MLSKLKNLDKNKDYIISSFEKAKALKVKRITYISNEGYGSGVNIYIAKKEKGFSPLCAFLGLWLKNTLCEEELNDFNYTKEECEEIYTKLFIDTAKGYSLNKLAAKDATIYMAKVIKTEIDNIKKENVQPNNESEVEFMDVEGVYVNKKYTTKNPLILRSTDEIIDAVELFSNDIMGQYKEMFLESKERYIYFF